MHVIGTAGHVDHGKSTLVQALTGIHPDRLKEEREREMTIDLGFAWLELPDGKEIGIVDVPGHRDFIENMLAGVGGIDATLFVVAADEGVMPQTREHLAILDVLQIQSGVIALTKIDLVDQEWLGLVQEDLRAAVAGTVLADAPIVPVSARTRIGIPELLNALAACLEHHSPRPDLGRPRLPIDRVFTIAGFGTVVTGTLSDGRFMIGDELEILPQGTKGRIRGLQTHKKKEEIAIPGGRTAVNIAGIALEQIQRGNVIAHPGDYRPTRRIDTRFRLLADVSQPLKHNTEVKLFVGAMEVIARVRLLGSDELLPGENGWLQLELSAPVIAIRGDHYILRRPSPGETLGGGMIVDPFPQKRHKRFSEETLTSLAALERGSPIEVFQQALLVLGIAPLKDVVSRSNIELEIALKTAQTLFEQGNLISLETRLDDRLSAGITSATTLTLNLNDLVVSKSRWEQLAATLVQEVRNYHTTYPLRPGMPREELKTRTKVLTNHSAKIFNAIIKQLVALNSIEENGPLVLIPGFQIRFTPIQEQEIKRLLIRFKDYPYSPPSVKECQTEVGEDLYRALVFTGLLVEVATEVAFRQEDYQLMVQQIRQLILRNGTITAAQVRDHFNTSRKYSLALLEHLDSIGMTVREGDTRRLKAK
jgi:selenocysteine-specific elongation factor